MGGLQKMMTSQKAQKRTDADGMEMKGSRMMKNGAK